MSKGLYTYILRKSGDVISASQYNADHQLHIDNGTLEQAGGHSDNVQQMQATTSPGAVLSESLAASVAGEIERLRFVIARIVSNNTRQWYEKPFGSIAKNRNTLVSKTTNQSVTAPAAITFDNEIFDDDNTHDNVVNNTRLTVPAGVTRIRLYGQLAGTGSTTTTTYQLWLRKNGTLDDWEGIPRISFSPKAVTNVRMTSFSTGVINVVAGDFFELIASIGTDIMTVSSGTDRTLFGMEIVRGGA